jgi:hypothetical protein
MSPGAAPSVEIEGLGVVSATPTARMPLSSGARLRWWRLAAAQPPFHPVEEAGGLAGE